MKTVKSKIHHHHHRKLRTSSHAAAKQQPIESEFSELDLALFRLERSPKQENL